MYRNARSRAYSDMIAADGLWLDLPADDPVRRTPGLPAATPGGRWQLQRRAGRLMLGDRQLPGQRPLAVDFDSPALRRRIAAGRRQPLARACGLPRRPDSLIVDATGGLGRDAWCLAALGARLRIQERHPLLYALLADALRQADPAIAGRIELAQLDSVTAPFPDCDVIYLDPMFPDTGRRAAPALEMQYLKQLVGPDPDVEALWRHALAATTRRVVLKRPTRGARVRLGEPDAQYGGGRAVYEAYFVTDRSPSR